MPITTKVVSSNPTNGEVCSIQHYVKKFVSDLRQVGGFLRFPPTIKLTVFYFFFIISAYGMTYFLGLFVFIFF
jgi:hypothetical protein